MGTLDHLVRQGKALYVGISQYSAEETKQASDILKRIGMPCLIHQLHYSMLHRW
jgi:L-glyceraldehyde 3-phosphate reductase